MNTETARRSLGFVKSLVVLAAVASAALEIKHAMSPTHVAGAALPPGAFSAARAMKHVEVLAKNPHPIGSAAHDEVRDYLVAQLKLPDVDVQAQDAIVTQRSGWSGSAHVQNVMARLKGRRGPEAVALVAHYDSAERSYGAADDGAGVAALLEIFRVMHSGPQAEHDVIFLITDGEEHGLLGARAFLAEHSWAKDIRMVVNLEARGTRGPAVMFQTSLGNAELIRAYARVVREPRATSLAATVYRMLPNDTDLTEFLKAGYPGYDIAFIEAPWNYHTPMDRLDTLDLRSLQQMGDACCSLAMHWSNAPLEFQSSRDAVYFNVFANFFVYYGVIQAKFFALVLAAMVACLGWRMQRRGELRWRSVSLGVVGPLVGLVASLGLLVVVNAAAFKLHVLLVHSRKVSFLFNDGYGAAWLAVTLLVSSLLFRFLAKRFAWRSLAFGALALAVILCLGMSFMVPEISYLLLWPCLGTCLALLVLSTRETSWKYAVAVALCVLPALFIFAPLLGSLAQTLSLRTPGLALMAVSASMLFWLALPLVEQLMRWGDRSLFVMLTLVVLWGGVAATRIAKNEVPQTRGDLTGTKQN